MPIHMHQLARAASVPAMVAGLCLFSAACGSQPQPAPAATASQPAAARYDLKGKVVSIDAANNALTVDHEEIPGFMAAMTMPYPVKDAQALGTLSPGDEITAKVATDGTSYWLEEIVVTRP
jgi:protein SCO1/2